MKKIGYLGLLTVALSVMATAQQPARRVVQDDDLYFSRSREKQQTVANTPIEPGSFRKGAKEIQYIPSQEQQKDTIR